MGLLPGSAQDMATSTAFCEVFKKLLNLNYQELYWQHTRATNGGQCTTNKFCVHYKIDRADIEKYIDIIYHNSTLVDNNFFGTQMTDVPIFTPFLDDEMKSRIDLHARRQEQIGQHVQSFTVIGIKITSLAEETKQHTVQRQLMTVESIYDKEVANSKSKKNFKSCIFYAILPNKKIKIQRSIIRKPTPCTLSSPLH